MSPTRSPDSDVTKGPINGPRPPPLRITKDSHVIHKSSSHDQAVVDNSCHATIPTGPKHTSPSTKRQPVIIYTHSPKVIHAQARDFMALVQKLTGLTRSDEKTTTAPVESNKQENTFPEEDDSSSVKNVGSEENISESYSVPMEIKQDSPTVLPIYRTPNPCLIDPPVFAASTSEILCTSRSNNPLFPIPSVSNSTSPGMLMDYMKGFP